MIILRICNILPWTCTTNTACQSYSNSVANFLFSTIAIFKIFSYSARFSLPKFPTFYQMKLLPKAQVKYKPVNWNVFKLYQLIYPLTSVLIEEKYLIKFQYFPLCFRSDTSHLLRNSQWSLFSFSSKYYSKITHHYLSLLKIFLDSTSFSDYLLLTDNLFERTTEYHHFPSLHFPLNVSLVSHFPQEKTNKQTNNKQNPPHLKASVTTILQKTTYIFTLHFIYLPTNWLVMIFPCLLELSSHVHEIILQNFFPYMFDHSFLS